MSYSIVILADEDIVKSTDFCRPLSIDARGANCDVDGYPTNFVKWAPVTLAIPEELRQRSVEELRDEGFYFEFVRGTLPARHLLNVRLYPTKPPALKPKTPVVMYARR